MAKRAAHTLIFLGSQRTDRVDFDAAPTFAALSQDHQNSQGSDDPVSRVEAALASSKPGKVVWVLWEGAGAQILEMPTAVVTGLEREQLADVLSFEAEPLTGIAVVDSAIDGIPQRNAPGALAEFKRFWIVQISAAIREKLDEAITRAGSKLGGVIHPGGLPCESWELAFAPEANREWRRIEIWDQLTFSLHGRPDGSVETRVIRSSPGSEAWTAELPTEGPLSWMGPGPVSRVSPGGQRVAGALVPLNPDGIPLELAKIDLPADAPVDWLRAWLTELTGKTRRVPVVESSSRVSPYQKHYLVGGVLTTLVLAACVLHGGLLFMKTSDARAKADRLENLRKQMAPADTSKKEEAGIASETEKLKATLKDLDQAKSAREIAFAHAQTVADEITKKQARLVALESIHRPALAELLGALVESEKTEKVGEIIVKEVRQDSNGDLRLTGLCKQSSLADAFATKLESRLSNAGWRVGAAQKQLRADGLAFDFTVVLTPLILLDSSGVAGQGSLAPPATAPAVNAVIGAESARAVTGVHHQ